MEYTKKTKHIFLPSENVNHEHDKKEVAKFINKTLKLKAPMTERQLLNMKQKVYTKEQKELLVTIIELTLKRKLEKEEVEKLIEKLKGGNSEMLAVLEMIDEENKRIFRNGKREGKREGKKEGKKEAKLETARKLLVAKIPVKIIMEATELSEEEINKLKKE